MQREPEREPLKAGVASSRFRSAAVGFACCTGFIEGYDLCVISSILLPVQRSLELCYPCGTGSTSELAECNCPQKSFAVSSIMLGAIFGGLSGGLIADRFGRLFALLTADSVFLSGCLLMVASAPSRPWSFFLGRCLVGLGVGVGGASSNSYLAEVVPEEQQAHAVQLNEVMLCVGCLASFLVAALLGDDLWRATVAVVALPCLAQLLAVSCLLPESPRWLALRGRLDEARRVSVRLGLRAPDKGEVKHPLVRRDSSLADLAHYSSARASSTYSLICQHHRALLLAVACAVAQAATGGSTVLYYSREVLEIAGFAHALWGEVLIGSVKLAGVLLALLLVSRTGAKPLLVVGVAGQIASHLMLAASLGLASGPSPRLAMWGLLLYVLCWDLGWAGMMLVVAAAVLPASVRGVGLGACWSCLWLCIFTISQSFGWAVDTCAAASLPPAAPLPCLARDPPSPPHTSLATPHVDSAPPCPLPGWACPGSSASSPPAASPPSSSSACACPATRGWGTGRRRRGGESRRASPTHRRAWPAGGARRYYLRGATAAWAPCSDRTQRSVPIPTAAAAASIITARESVYRVDY